MMNNTKDSLGDRMKNNYENRAKTYLTRRTPVIIRLDGRSFHTFTKGLKRPYDTVFHNAMNKTMKYLCENIQGCKIGYTQSDEITLLLTDYDTLDTCAWFDYNVQKICSISASMATMAFNKNFQEEAIEAIDNYYEAWNTSTEDEKYVKILEKAIDKGAMFDARCFNIPKEEVTNCFLWRQQDCTRNAIQMLGQCNFSHKELQSKSCNDIQDMLMLQKHINFNDMPTAYKRGVCYKRIITQDPEVDIKDVVYPVHQWIFDDEIPIFSKNRDYIENLL